MHMNIDLDLIAYLTLIREDALRATCSRRWLSFTPCKGRRDADRRLDFGGHVGRFLVIGDFKVRHLPHEVWHLLPMILVGCVLRCAGLRRLDFPSL